MVVGIGEDSDFDRFITMEVKEQATTRNFNERGVCRLEGLNLGYVSLREVAIDIVDRIDSTLRSLAQEAGCRAPYILFDPAALGMHYRKKYPAMAAAVRVSRFYRAA